MSYPNNIRNGPYKSVLFYGPQRTTSPLNMPSTPIMSSYQPRTPMDYSQPQNMPRGQLTESEPLSPYSEVQIPMSPMRPTHQLNPMNSAYFRSQEATLQHHLSSNPQLAANITQNSKNNRMMESRSQRMGSHDVRASPYARPSVTPQTQPSRLPPPSPHAPSYNPDLPFVMRSSTSSSADWNVSLNAKKPDVAGFTKKNSDSLKTTSQTEKLTSMNRKRFLIGSIDQIVQWNKLAKKSDLYVIYEVTGILESVSYNSTAKVYKMTIRDDLKTSFLQAVFFPIDREIPEVRTGALITFIGRMIGARRLQVYSMWPTNANSLAGLKRISFLCQRTLQEACLSAPEP